jgi:hypothetical protein
MRYFALACDYDETLASHGLVAPEGWEAIKRLRASGRRAILVTGRGLDDLPRLLPEPTLFDRIVAENGALLYRPQTHEEKLLGEPPPPRFVRRLSDRQVSPLHVGRVIVATTRPHDVAALETIGELGLELQLIYNKSSVMILPSGINKATGLIASLKELGLSPHNVVGVGDAENDHAFLKRCEASVAVPRALPSIREEADWISPGGVVELIEHLCFDDLNFLEPKLRRHRIDLGIRDDGVEIAVPPYGANLLIMGTSGSGKSTLATGFLERLSDHAYQFCVIDPEGDYQTFEGPVVLGTAKRAPTVSEVLQILEQPEQNAVVNLLGVSLEHRPSFFDTLLSALMEMRSRTGRPHWIVIDKSHHLLPSEWEPTQHHLPKELRGLLLITVHPEHVSRAVLSQVDGVLAVGETPQRTLSASWGSPSPN